jgi:hypothetical protein
MSVPTSFMHTYKNNKKIKSFLDDKTKPKQRIQNLWGFIGRHHNIPMPNRLTQTTESATEQETEALITAHEGMIFTVLSESFNAQVERLQGKIWDTWRQNDKTKPKGQLENLSPRHEIAFFCFI